MEIICRRPRQRGQRRASSEKTLSIYLWPFDGSPEPIEVGQKSVTSINLETPRSALRKD